MRSWQHSKLIGRQMGDSMEKKKIRWHQIVPFYVMMIPGLIYLIINNYLPMFGTIIAFKKLNFQKGILGSDWVGLQNFRFLFASNDAWIIIRNTLGYNLVNIILGTILALFMAIILNEIRGKLTKTIYQSLVLLPFLMSWVVVSYLCYAYLSSESGLINAMITRFGGKSISWYTEPKYWPFILVFFNIWKGIGYNMIIYYAGIVGISQDYFEAARLDGGTKWQQIRFITLPLMIPTIITLMILSVGQIFRSDFGLFYQLPRNSGALYSVTQTLDVYVYNALMKNNDFGKSSATSFIQSIVGLVLVIITNKIATRYDENSALF